MPSYGASTARLTALLTPVMTAGPFVPGRVFPFSGTPTFGVAASQPIYADQATTDGGFPVAAITAIDLFYLNAQVPNPVEFVNIGAESFSANLLGFPFFSQWRGLMALANNPLGSFDFWTFKGGVVNVVSGPVPPWYNSPNVNGTPLRWQGRDYLVHALDMTFFSGGAVLLDNQSVINPDVWPGPDPLATTAAPPTYPDEGDGFNYFFQDGRPLATKRPSIVKASSTTGAVASYTSITLDSMFWDAEWRSIISGAAYAVCIVPGGFLFTGQGYFILLSKDGSTYSVYEPIAGDAAAADQFGLGWGPIGTPSNLWSAFVIQGLPVNGEFWMVSQQGTVDGVTLHGPLFPRSDIVRTISFGCWPCLPVANGTR